MSKYALGRNYKAFRWTFGRGYLEVGGGTLVEIIPADAVPTAEQVAKYKLAIGALNPTAASVDRLVLAREGGYLLIPDNGRFSVVSST